MSIQCGICKNVMPSSSFLSHKERKHSMVQHVPYINLPDIVFKVSESINSGQLIKCRFCPNRILENAMERHLKRGHIVCHLCDKTFLKSNFNKHMQKKHDNNLGVISSLSQSKSSIQSDSDFMASTLDALTIHEPSPISSPSLPVAASASTSIYQSTNSSSIKIESEVIRVNELQLHNYIRQGRVYTKNGCLYLRNMDIF